MYRRIEKLFRGDISTLRGFCKLAQPEQLPFFEEIERQFHTEFNYSKEALNLEEIANNLDNEKWSKKVVVPRAYHELCSHSVLVMDYLPGDKLITAVMKKYEAIAKQQGLLSVSRFETTLYFLTAIASSPITAIADESAKGRTQDTSTRQHRECCCCPTLCHLNMCHHNSEETLKFQMEARAYKSYTAIVDDLCAICVQKCV